MPNFSEYVLNRGPPPLTFWLLPKKRLKRMSFVQNIFIGTNKRLCIRRPPSLQKKIILEEHPIHKLVAHLD